MDRINATKKIGSWALIALFAFAVYLPALTAQFGWANDFALLPSDFYEATHLYKIGRPLAAYGHILQAKVTNHISDFRVSRLVSLFLALGFCGIFVRFVRRRTDLSPAWSFGLALGLIILPTTQFYVLTMYWIIPGFLAINLALLSYVIFDNSFLPDDPIKTPRRLAVGPRLLLSAALFIGSLCLYQPNAMLVFTCSFVRMLGADKRLKLRLILRDLIWHLFFVFLYFLFVKYLLLAHLPAWVEQYVPEDYDPLYKFEASFSLWDKVSLIWTTLLAAAGGFFYSPWGKTGSMVNTAVLVAGMAALCHRDVSSGKIAFSGRKLFITWGVPAGVWGAYVCLVNIPQLAAVNCKSVLGYRALFPTGVLLWVTMVYVLQRTDRERIVRGIKAVPLFFLGILILSGAVLTRYDVGRRVAEASHRYEYLGREFDRIDLSDTTDILVANPRGRVDYRESELDFEGMFWHTAPYFYLNSLLKDKGAPGIPVILNRNPVLLLGPKTRIIDVCQEYAEDLGQGCREYPRAYLTTSASLSRDVAVRWEKQILHFQEGAGSRKLPFWAVDLTHGQPWIQVAFREDPRALRHFIFQALAMTQDNQRVSLAFRLMGSRDHGATWDSLETVTPYPQAPEIHFVVSAAPYQAYRFMLVNETKSPRFLIPFIRAHFMF